MNKPGFWAWLRYWTKRRETDELPLRNREKPKRNGKRHKRGRRDWW